MKTTRRYSRVFADIYIEISNAKGNPEKVLAWIRSGELKASNVGRIGTRPSWRVKQADLDSFLANRQPVQPQPRRRKLPPPPIEYY